MLLIFIAGNKPKWGLNLKIVGFYCILQKIFQKKQSIFPRENFLIKGYAGVWSLIDNPFSAGRNPIAGLLFWGIVMAKDKPKPGSLMISKLTVKSKINK